MDKVYLKKNSNFTEVSAFYKKVGDVWQTISQSEFRTYLTQIVPIFKGELSYRFEIAAPQTLTAETCQVLAMYNDENVTSAVQWTIASGSDYATIGNNGLVEVLDGASGESITILATYGHAQTSHTMSVYYKYGSTSETTTETIVDESGNSTTTTTTTTENEDGSTSVEEVVVIVDESGNTLGSTETNTETNADGSFTGSTTNYNADGEPTDATNSTGDTQGNVNKQEVEYDENGNSAVTGYVIDTSENPDGSKTYNGEGTNTEYYAFDLTHGFVTHIHFYINFSNQPPGQNENHHNILTMKRATPQPWYGFQLRHSNANKVIILGTQFATGSNTNTNITGTTTASANTVEYDLTITYNPTASTGSFVCYNNLTNKNVYTSNLKFPDIDELKYLKVMIGCAMDENGNPYRYSNVDILDFSITRT